MRITARDIHELVDFIVKNRIWIIRHRNAFYRNHCGRIEDIDGIRVAARYKGKMTRWLNDDPMCRGLPRHSRYVRGRGQNVFADVNSIHIAGAFIRDE
jgi:hypothetical protein